MYGLGRKLTGALMVLIGGFFVVAAIKAIVTTPETAQRLKDAPFITDGVLDPANEGKDVILAFNIEDIGDASDEDFGLSFAYPCVTRNVEKLTCTLPNQKWEWRRVRDADKIVRCRSFCGDGGVGDYQIEGDLLRGLALYTDLYSDDFDQAELAGVLERFDGLSTQYWNDKFYISNTDSIYFDDFEYDGTDSATRMSYEREEGAIRISYKGLPRAWYSQIAVVGRQEGNWIVEDESLDTMTVFEDVKDAKSLASRDVRLVVGGIALAMLVCAPLIIFGFRRIFTDY